jgi:hypothetical protein
MILHEGQAESIPLVSGVVSQSFCSPVTNGEYEIISALESSLFNRHEVRSGDVDQRPVDFSLDGQRRSACVFSRRMVCALLWTISAISKENR